MEYTVKKSFTLSDILISFLKFYKSFISPFLPPMCRFRPTCSEYMMIAIKKHGIFKGLIMGITRILRCNPLCSGGYDPVPDKFSILRNKNEQETKK
ncbi:MAG TPA: membrane protein insertion efficiency factor YidD [Victivallales bacterium]|nr:membrane protein insertion efficiency factor YidD [Victivallales bacterium]